MTEHPLIRALVMVGSDATDRECLLALLTAMAESDSGSNETITVHTQAALWRLQQAAN